MNFRDLTKEDVECRVASVSKNGSGLTLLLYKNARVDMNILDEIVGCEKWQREHYECKGNLFCKVGILCETGWIWKSDCGIESNAEAKKGEASDSFKRACFNWGIGRELYSAPFIWVDATNCNIKDNKCYDKFECRLLKVENKRIVDLQIYNKTKKCLAFVMRNSTQNSQTKTKIDALIELAKSKNVTVLQLENKYRTKDLTKLTDEQYSTCVAGLQKMVNQND